MYVKYADKFVAVDLNYKLDLQRVIITVTMNTNTRQDKTEISFAYSFEVSGGTTTSSRCR